MDRPKVARLQKTPVKSKARKRDVIEVILKGKPRMGRPPEAVPEQDAKDLCAWISRGKTLASWCRKTGWSLTAVKCWAAKDPEFAARYARACEIGYDAMADRLLAVARRPVLFPEDVNQRRLEIDTYKWWLARRSRRYNEKVQVEHEGGVNVTVLTGVPQPKQLEERDDVE